mmetsp:Transcript_101598/g.313470  ORF Transcript_101598/g.313470 Transcript_101598/m.313470 type:complete len:330 (+) Transcript_101598:1072-2061(+)
MALCRARDQGCGFALSSLAGDCRRWTRCCKRPKSSQIGHSVVQASLPTTAVSALAAHSASWPCASMTNSAAKSSMELFESRRTAVARSPVAREKEHSGRLGSACGGGSRHHLAYECSPDGDSTSRGSPLCRVKVGRSWESSDAWTMMPAQLGSWSQAAMAPNSPSPSSSYMPITPPSAHPACSVQWQRPASPPHTRPSTPASAASASSAPASPGAVTSLWRQRRPRNSLAFATAPVSASSQAHFPRKPAACEAARACVPEILTRCGSAWGDAQRARTAKAVKRGQPLSRMSTQGAAKISGSISTAARGVWDGHAVTCVKAITIRSVSNP